MKKRLAKISAIILTAAVVAGGAGGVNAFAAAYSSSQIKNTLHQYATN